MDYEVLILGVLLLAIVLVVLAARWLYFTELISYALSRKILHLSAIGISAFSILVITDVFMLECVVAATIPILFFLIYRGFFQNPETGQKSWGILYFSISFLSLLLLFGDEPSFVFYPLLTLAVADGLAAIVGELIGKHKFAVGEMTKTWEGSLTFMFSCLICLGVLPTFFPDIPIPLATMTAVLIVSFALTLVEALFENGTDNLTIPSLLVYWMTIDVQFMGVTHILLAIGIIGLGMIAYKLKALSLSGGIAAVLMGLILIISPLPLWTIPPMVLFAIGTFLTKMPGGIERSGGNRNALQVMANGAIPCIFLMLYFALEDVGLLIGSMSGFAAALSDTASSEIGTRYKQRTYRITSFTPVPVGLSGGVSMVGIIAGMVFSFLMAAVVFSISDHMSVSLFILVGAAGMFGNLCDSFLGDLIQIRYRPSGAAHWSDQPTGSNEEETKGFKWVGNNAVNFIAVLFASCLGYFLFGVF